jgi:hypothetical protein
MPFKPLGVLKDEPPQDVPPQLPVTIIDMERTSGIYDMHLHMADPCPNCGAFNMHVGDWVCWGACYPCVRSMVIPR